MAKGGKKRWRSKARGGRPRKPIEAAERKPNGRARDRRDPGPTAEAIQRRQEMLPDCRDASVLVSAEAGSVLGRLYLAGIITDVQRKAGQRYQRIVERYNRLLLAPRQPGVADPNRIPGGQQGEESSAQIVRFAQAKAEYDTAFEAVRQAGRLAQLAIRHAIHEEQPEIEALKAALTALVLAGRAIARAGQEAGEAAFERCMSGQDVPAQHKMLTTAAD